MAWTDEATPWATAKTAMEVIVTYFEGLSNETRYGHDRNAVGGSRTKTVEEAGLEEVMAQLSAWRTRLSPLRRA